MGVWRGVMVATALPYKGDDVDLERYGEHVKWLLDNGCDGVVPNGSLGEYQVLTPAEREAVVRQACEAAPGRVMPGVAAYGALEARRWAELAAEAGCPAVMLLPPNGYRADEEVVEAHYREVAKAGLPIVAYNNPFDTKVDLTPEMLARLHGEGLIVGVKEFSGDVRRAYRLAELAPTLDLIVGADDVLVELRMAGAVGWVAGFPNAFPRSCVELYHSLEIPLYRTLHPLLRWDSDTLFVQAIKLSMDLAGRYGGPCRPPRLPLPAKAAEQVKAATLHALESGCR